MFDEQCSLFIERTFFIMQNYQRFNYVAICNNAAFDFFDAFAWIMLSEHFKSAA